MNSEVILHLLCGKMAAGKSTLARELTQKHSAILLVEDTFLSALYSDQIIDLPSYIKYSDRLLNGLSSHVSSLLSNGVSVVLDFPANTIEQRKRLRAIYEGTGSLHVLHFVDASDEKCKFQLRQRSKGLPEGTAFTSDAEFNAITKYFQPPTKNEGFNIEVYSKG